MKKRATIIVITLLATLLLIVGCEDKRLKRAQAEAALWKAQAAHWQVEAAQWEQTANAWEATTNRAVAAAQRCQLIASALQPCQKKTQGK